jgi:hypothetical protein
VKQERSGELAALGGSPCARSTPASSSRSDDTEAARDEGDDGADDDFMPSRGSSRSRRWGARGAMLVQVQVQVLVLVLVGL